MHIVSYLGRFERNREGRLGDRKRERRRQLGRGASRTRKKSRVGESERNRRLGRSTCRVARACGPAISRGSLVRQAPRTSQGSAPLTAPPFLTDQENAKDERERNSFTERERESKRERVYRPKILDDHGVYGFIYRKYLAPKVLVFFLFF